MKNSIDCPGSDPGRAHEGNQRGSDQTGAGFGPSRWKLPEAPEAQPAQEAQPVPGSDQRPGPFPICAPAARLRQTWRQRSEARAGLTIEKKSSILLFTGSNP